MRVDQHIRCSDFPCEDIRKECYVIPDVELDPGKVSVIVISESAPATLEDYYYAPGEPHFAQTTVTAFDDAGIKVSSISDILDLGVYLTTAVKCAKTGYGIRSATIQTCSHLLEQEIVLFPNVKAFLLMGDVAIQAVNYIARRVEGKRAIPAGSTYKIRSGEFYFQGRRAYPSYLQVGPSFNIEKSKRAMIAQDIAAALALRD